MFLGAWCGRIVFLVPGGSLGTPATSLIFLFLLSLSAAFDFGGMIKVRMCAGSFRISRVFAPKRRFNCVLFFASIGL